MPPAPLRTLRSTRFHLADRAGDLHPARAVESSASTILYGDVNGDKAADFAITVDKTAFAAGDFVL